MAGQEFFAPMRLNPPRGSNLQDFMGAMQAFNQGLQSYATQRAINGATDQVNSLRMADMNDQDRKNQLNQVALNLTGQLTSLGVPTSHINDLVSQFQPKDRFYQTPFEAITQGDSATAQKAQSYLDQQRQSNLDAIDEKIDAKMRALGVGQNAVGPNGQPQMDQKTMKWWQSEADKANDKANASIASSRSGLGRLGVTMQKIQDLRNGLLQSGDKSGINLVTMNELAKGMDSIFQQGQATVSGSQHLIPPSIQQAQAKLLALGGNIDNIDQPQLVKTFDDVLGRMQDVVGAQQRAAAKSVLGTKLGLAQVNADMFSKALPEKIIHNPDGSPETARIENGQIRFHSDDQIQQLKQAAQHVIQNPTDKNSQTDLQMIVNDPFYTQAVMEDPSFKALMNQAASRVTSVRYGGPTPAQQQAGQ